MIWSTIVSGASANSHVLARFRKRVTYCEIISVERCMDVWKTVVHNACFFLGGNSYSTGCMYHHKYLQYQTLEELQKYLVNPSHHNVTVKPFFFRLVVMPEAVKNKSKPAFHFFHLSASWDWSQFGSNV